MPTCVMENNINLIDPIADSDRDMNKTSAGFSVFFPTASAKWVTPGMFFANEIGKNSLIRFIGEKVDVNNLQIIIIIDDDPEDLIDNIFSVEQQIYEAFKYISFDLRVSVVPLVENIKKTQQTSTNLYNRDD